jgi:hypothetical protein
MLGGAGWSRELSRRQIMAITQKPESKMKMTSQWLAVAGVVTLMLLGGGKVAAQNNPPGGRQGRGRGNFDPGQFQQRILDNVREQFAIKDDAEWKAIEPLVQKVMDARRESMFGGARMMFRRPGRGNDGGPNRGRRFGGEPSPEAEALRKAIDSKASKEELKAKMAAYRKMKEANEQKLIAAQDELKKVLTTEQEAVALEMGLVR